MTFEGKLHTFKRLNMLSVKWRPIIPRRISDRAYRYSYWCFTIYTCSIDTLHWRRIIVMGSRITCNQCFKQFIQFNNNETIKAVHCRPQGGSHVCASRQVILTCIAIRYMLSLRDNAGVLTAYQNIFLHNNVKTREKHQIIRYLRY